MTRSFLARISSLAVQSQQTLRLYTDVIFGPRVFTADETTPPGSVCDHITIEGDLFSFLLRHLSTTRCRYNAVTRVQDSSLLNIELRISLSYTNGYRLCLRENLFGLGVFFSFRL